MTTKWLIVGCCVVAVGLVALVVYIGEEIRIERCLTNYAKDACEGDNNPVYGVWREIRNDSTKGASFLCLNTTRASERDSKYYGREFTNAEMNTCGWSPARQDAD